MILNLDSWLLSKPIAHRGLWGEDMAENSIPAFIRAGEKGFAIETDIYSTLDGEIVCVHDKNLLRLTGLDKNVCDLTLKEVKALYLNNGKDKIPTLKEVLSVCMGKAPLLIEFKNQPDNSYVKRAVEILKDYKGEFAVQSFNPFILRTIKKLAPEFLRGILSSKTPGTENKLEKFVVKRMPFNFLCKPQFISFEYNGLPLKNRLRKKYPVLAWTVTDKNILKEISPYCDNIIFENFIP
jgi:glycerophosphoryl diester phosphodiesterase